MKAMMEVVQRGLAQIAIVSKLFHRANSTRKRLLTLGSLLLVFNVSSRMDSQQDYSQPNYSQPNYICYPMWTPPFSFFDPVWVPDWNVWLPTFSPDALLRDSDKRGDSGVWLLSLEDYRYYDGWIPWNPLAPCRLPWPPIFLPIPPIEIPRYPPPENQAIYLGSGSALVDGAEAICATPSVALLAATGQTGFGFPFPPTSFPTFGGYTHLTSPTPGGTYLNTLYSWHKINLVIVPVYGGQGTPIESYRPNQPQNYEYIVYDADGTALRFRWENNQLKPAFGVHAQLLILGDTYALIGGPPGALNQKGAWIYFFTGDSEGYAWGSGRKARVLTIRDPLGNYWRQVRDDRLPNRIVWVSPNNVFLGFDPDGTVYFSANANPPEWQQLGKTPGPLNSGAPRGTSEIISWGDTTDPNLHIAFRWHVSLPVRTGGVTLEAGHLQGGNFVAQVRRNWQFTDQPQGYSNGQSEQLLYMTMYGTLPENYYGRLRRQSWGDAFPTLIEYRDLRPFGVETRIFRENLDWDYTLIRHVENDSDKKFNWVEIERPRFHGVGVSRERIWLSATNGKIVKREFFDYSTNQTPTWVEQYEYNFANDPLALTGYVDRQGNRYQAEYEQRATNPSWNPQDPERETVLKRAIDPTGVETRLHYGESYTLPPWQIVRSNPPTVPSSVQIGSHSERRWRLGYYFNPDLQRMAPNGLLLGFKEPERDWWLFGYTSLNHPHPYQLARITDPTGRFTQMTRWDALGRPTRTESYPYWNGSVGGWDTQRPVWQEVTYDPIGRVQRVEWGYSNIRHGSISYQWEGHLLKGITDARGRRIELTYNQRPPYLTGLLNDIFIVGQNGERQRYTSFGYDWWGRLTRVEGGNGVGLDYTYTYRDAVKWIRHDGDRDPEEFYYSDCCGQVSRWTRQDGQQLMFEHTPNGWLSRIRYKSNPSSSARELYRYSYDAAGRLTEAQSEVSTVRATYDTTDYDRTGWLESTQTILNGQSHTFRYDYYLNGDVRTVLWEGQSGQQFTYDSAGRITSQSYQRSGIPSLSVSYDYDGADRLTRQTVRVGNQTLETSIVYGDAFGSPGLVKWQTTMMNGREVAHFGYDYWADGTLQAANEMRGQRQLAWDYHADGSLAYEHDTLQGGRRDFVYDAGGNLIRGVPAAPNTLVEYQYNQLPQIGNWRFVYNPNGERTGEYNAPDGTRQYIYDGFGNLVGVVRNGQTLYQAQYDALDRRVAYWTPETGWRYLLYNGDVLVAELYPWGGLAAEYVWGELGPVARIEHYGLFDYRVLLYVMDAQGHVRMLVDANTGEVTDQYAYDAWGNLIFRQGSTRQPFTWNGAYGYEWIPEIGLYHVGARAYDPRTSRWLQRDPISASSGDPNLYRYCYNDPVNAVDPTGLHPIYILLELQDMENGLKRIKKKRRISEGRAIEARVAGKNVLVRGDSLEQARLAAEKVERTAARQLGLKDHLIHHDAHTDPRIVNPRPHYQTKGHRGHTFYEARGASRHPGRTNAGHLRGPGRALGVLGLALGALNIAQAATDPCGALGSAIGSFVGGYAGAAIGAAIGTAIAPGVGTVIGGFVGGILGALTGEAVGRQFDPSNPCGCP